MNTQETFFVYTSNEGIDVGIIVGFNIGLSVRTDVGINVPVRVGSDIGINVGTPVGGFGFLVGINDE